MELSSESFILETLRDLTDEILGLRRDIMSKQADPPVIPDVLPDQSSGRIASEPRQTVRSVVGQTIFQFAVENSVFMPAELRKRMKEIYAFVKRDIEKKGQAFAGSIIEQHAESLLDSASFTAFLHLLSTNPNLNIEVVGPHLYFDRPQHSIC